MKGTPNIEQKLLVNYRYLRTCVLRLGLPVARQVFGKHYHNFKKYILGL